MEVDWSLALVGVTFIDASVGKFPWSFYCRNTDLGNILD
jgi:hypothetical protein